MRKLVVLLAVLTVIGIVQVANARPHPSPRPPCTVQQFRPISAAVWDLNRWERGKPAEAGIAAYHHALGCAISPAHHWAIKRTWLRDRAAYNDRRSDLLYREKWTPFYYGGGWWAAPYPVALCESGGHYFYSPELGQSLPYGAYGLILEPTYQSRREQDRDAYRLLHTVGAEQAWFRWEREQGCPLL